MKRQDAARLLLKHLEMEEERRLCASHPAHLLDQVRCVDAKTGERFEFHLKDETSGWYWQRGVLDMWVEHDKSACLKARQLGITWLAGGLGLWTVLYRPGTRVLCVSIKEDEAAKLVGRIWDMFESLPVHLKNGVKVLKPKEGHRPSTVIELQHENGMVSTITGLPSSPKAGHGETAALAIYDEFARQEYAEDTYTAGLPTIAGGGKIIIISTANGVSSVDTQGNPRGNFFHHLWTHAETYGIETQFLAWDLHPDRDEKWYREYAMALPARKRAEQFPRNPHEAFLLSGAQYFDEEALAWYAEHGIRRPLYSCRFSRTAPDKARMERSKHGCIHVFEEPIPDHSYAIAVDTATGRGQDYCAATVIDLNTMAFAAKIHGKLDADHYAFQLHYLGRWYKTAQIAVESAGGYGEAVTMFLRDGKDGRPAYPKLYRHRLANRPDFHEHKAYGFPMTSKTRPMVLAGLERAIREKALPWVDGESLHEYQTFVEHDSGTSPRAQEGCNDDRVMADAIAVEMYRQRGEHPDKVIRRAKRQKVTSYPWQHAA